MSTHQLAEQYRRYGPLIFSRYRRALQNEDAAARATLSAFERLIRLGSLDDQKVVAFLKHQIPT